MIPLVVNDVFEYGSKKYRLLAVLPRSQPGGAAAPLQLRPDTAWLIDIEDAAALPIFWPLAVLVERASDPRKLQVIEQNAGARPISTSPADQAVGQLRWGRIKDLVGKPGILSKDSRGALLREHSEAIGIHKDTLLRHLRMWWQGGQVQNALLGNYWRSGHVDQAEGAVSIERKSEGGTEVVVFAPPSQRSRGRPPVYLEYQPFVIPAAMAEAVVKVAWKHVKPDESRSVRGATTRVLAQLFCLRDEKGQPLRDDKGRAVLRPLGQRPTEAQIRRLLWKNKSASEKYKAQNGRAEFDNEVAPKTGTIFDDTNGPGDVFEIDATIVDIYAVDKATRTKILGKATLYLVIDRYTRLIVGFHLSLENPSWAEAQLAILSIAGDWKGVCERLNVRYDKSDWPAHGRLPNRFIADRADMMSGASDALCEGVLTQVTNAPPLHSSDKGIVESGFRTTHAQLRQFAPGYEPPEKARKRRAKPYWKDACLTLDELAAVYLRVIIKHNRTHKPGYDATPEQIMSGCSLAPKDLWQREVVRSMGLGSRMPVDLLRKQLLPRDKATVTQQGISFRHCFYEASELGEWFTRAEIYGSFEVDVSYTSNLVNTILVHRPDGGIVTGKLTSRSARKFLNYSFAEVHAVHKVAMLRKAMEADSAQGHEVAMVQDIDAIVEPAQAATHEATKELQHPGNRLANSSEARTEEQRLRRPDTHSLDNEPAPYQPVSAAAPAPAPECGQTEPASSRTSGTPLNAPAPAADHSTRGTQEELVASYTLPEQDAVDGEGTGLDVMDTLYELTDEDNLKETQ